MSEQAPLRLWYRQGAPCANDFIAERDRGDDPMDGWEKWSLPIGNGYLGANVFGRTGTERIQITENSLCNPGPGGGLNSFAELLIDFHHEQAERYERELDLEEGMARVSYALGEITYRRELFASYPDRVLAMRLTASRAGALSFTLRPQIPFLKRSEAGYGKTGYVLASGDTATLSGEMEYYRIQFEGQFRVLAEGGETISVDGGIQVRGADSAVIVAAVGTNYRLESRVFTESDPEKKLAPYPNPHAMVTTFVECACALGYDLLRKRHLADYRALFGRVRLHLGEAGAQLPTDELLARYRAGERLPYLEALYYQFGRYLLISCSRKGALPANLQGVWNCYDRSPWGAGYWHNINVQMNYWPAFVANLAETFEAYAAYAEAYLPLAREMADEYVRALFPEKLDAPGRNGWIIGTAAYPYTITNAMSVKDGKPAIDHSGPGTGAFTSILFWERYAFTRDERALESAFSILREMSLFLSKTVEERDGKLLVRHSASPEQMVEGLWRPGGAYYHTVGCAFDQQMIYENHLDLLRAARLLGREDDPVVRLAREQIERLDPVQVGASGQIKEYREEAAYGEIGEWHHRHISQLVGLYPGSLIHRGTPEWLVAARVTLNLRGDQSTGWAMAHRLNAWARALDGERAYQVYRALLSHGTLPNLWDTHPPYQIDGNLGGVSGVSELLLQSHAGCVDVLPALPDAWQTGSFHGLVARGNLVVDAAWENGFAMSVTVTARAAGEVCLRCGRMKSPALFTASGARMAGPDGDGAFRLAMRPGEMVRLRPLG